MLFYGDPVAEEIDRALFLVGKIPAKRVVDYFRVDRLRARIKYGDGWVIFFSS